MKPRHDAATDLHCDCYTVDAGYTIFAASDNAFEATALQIGL